MNILVTGSCGFIGYHLCRKLLSHGHTVYGIDNLNDYYDVSIKKQRNKLLCDDSNYHFFYGDINNISKIYDSCSIPIVSSCDIVYNLAAKAGVRDISVDGYIRNNVTGFVSVISECAKYNKPLIYASSSSVYDDKYSLLTIDAPTSPKSHYAKTKKMNEDISKMYFDNFNVNSIGLRFFSVYGPYGRPDMALWKFTKNIIDGKEIEVYGDGEQRRCFTYIDDLIDNIYNIKNEYCTIRNVCCDESISINTLIKEIENNVGKKAKIIYKDRNKFDSISNNGVSDVVPRWNYKKGIEEFISWYRRYYNV